jgi:phage shock protein A
LYNGKITHGEYLVKKKEIYSQYKKAREQRELEIQRYNAQIVSEAVNSFVTQLNNQQLINTLNNSPTRIAPFTCQNYGRTINCW